MHSFLENKISCLGKQNIAMVSEYPVHQYLSPPAPKANYLPRIHRRSIMERYVSFSFEDRDFLVTLIGRIGWCLDSGDDFSTVRTDGSRNVAFNGCTEWKGWPDAFQSISIAWQNLEPLLTSVLSESRRLLVQFQVAKTVKLY